MRLYLVSRKLGLHRCQRRVTVIKEAAHFVLNKKYIIIFRTIQRNVWFDINLLPAHNKAKLILLMYHTIRFVELQKGTQHWANS